MKKSLKNNPGGRLIWQLHRVVEPVQVLSLRVTQGHFEDAEPKFGNRLVAHVLVKFDTEQVGFSFMSVLPLESYPEFIFRASKYMTARPDHCIPLLN